MLYNNKCSFQTKAIKSLFQIHPITEEKRGREVEKEKEEKERVEKEKEEKGRVEIEKKKKEGRKEGWKKEKEKKYSESNSK